MSLAHDLLAQAEHLATLDGRKPKQANIRRSISVAYYSLFHFLISEAMRVIAPKEPATLAARMGRAFNHSAMKEVCGSIVFANSRPLKELVPLGFSPELKQIAKAFLELQEARHIADYDTTAKQSRADALALIQSASGAFASWSKVRDSGEANVFLCALLLQKHWGK